MQEKELDGSWMELFLTDVTRHRGCTETSHDIVYGMTVHFLWW